MKKTVFIYGIILAAGSIFLKSMEYFYTVQVFSIEIYITLIALAFVALGIWAGQKVTTPKNVKVTPFKKNEKAIKSLQISERELEVLDLVASGLSNKEIADQLYISLNTVKTHLTSLYAKMDVSRRTEAVQKARSLRLIH